VLSCRKLGARAALQAAATIPIGQKKLPPAANPERFACSAAEKLIK
jgi:hypothetical protein